MKVIAGSYRSRLLKSLPGDATRPTLAKVKEAVFSSIGPYFNGGMVLDLFAGSGGIGIECLSRGFEKSIFVDKSPSAIGVINENLKILEIENQQVLRMDYEQALKKCHREGLKFDLIYLDPPYQEKIVNEILGFVEENNLLNSLGIIICETAKEDILLEDSNYLEKRKEAIYGITKISIYRKKG